MSKKFLAVACVLCCATAVAAEAAELKLAVVDRQQAIVGTEAGKSRIAALEQQHKAEVDELRRLEAELTQMQERARKDSEVMAEPEKRRLAKEFEDKQADYQFKASKLQKAIQDAQQELAQEMLPRVNAIVQDLIQLEGYDVVVERQMVMWANPKHDITRRVIEKLNERPTAAAARPAPPAPAAN